MRSMGKASHAGRDEGHVPTKQSERVESPLTARKRRCARPMGVEFWSAATMIGSRRRAVALARTRASRSTCRSAVAHLSRDRGE